ncbi:MAG: hypothetical protein ACRDQ4_14090 [Pseudonocardiaceae bacterium]
MTRDMVAAALMFLLLGAIAGWCAGWAGRGEQNRARHQGALARARAELANTHTRLDNALTQLDDTLTQLDDARARGQAPGAPAVVHVHVATPVPWTAHQPLPPAPTRMLDAAPVLPAGELP